MTSSSSSESSATRESSKRRQLPKTPRGGPPLFVQSISLWSKNSLGLLEEALGDIRPWSVIGVQYANPAVVGRVQAEARVQGATVLVSPVFGGDELASILLLRIPCGPLRYIFLSGEDCERDWHRTHPLRTKLLARNFCTQWVIVPYRTGRRVLIGHVTTWRATPLESRETPTISLLAIQRLVDHFQYRFNIQRESVILGDFPDSPSLGRILSIPHARCAALARSSDSQIVSCGVLQRECSPSLRRSLAINCRPLRCRPSVFAERAQSRVLFFTWNVFPVTSFEGYWEATEDERAKMRDEHVQRQLVALLSYLGEWRTTSPIWCCLQEVEGFFEQRLARELQARGWPYQILYQSSRQLLTLLLGAPLASCRTLRMTDVTQYLFMQISCVRLPSLGEITCVNVHARRPVGGCPKVDDLLERIWARVPEKLPGTFVVLGDFNRKDADNPAWDKDSGEWYGDWPVKDHLGKMNTLTGMPGRHYAYPCRDRHDYPPNDHIFVWTRGQVQDLRDSLDSWPAWPEDYRENISDHYPLAVAVGLLG